MTELLFASEIAHFSHGGGDESDERSQSLVNNEDFAIFVIPVPDAARG
jgi:hypothetical protein